MKDNSLDKTLTLYATELALMDPDAKVAFHLAMADIVDGLCYNTFGEHDVMEDYYDKCDTVSGRIFTDRKKATSTQMRRLDEKFMAVLDSVTDLPDPEDENPDPDHLLNATCMHILFSATRFCMDYVNAMQRDRILPAQTEVEDFEVQCDELRDVVLRMTADYMEEFMRRTYPEDKTAPLKMKMFVLDLWKSVSESIDDSDLEFTLEDHLVNLEDLVFYLEEHDGDEKVIKDLQRILLQLRHAPSPHPHKGAGRFLS